MRRLKPATCHPPLSSTRLLLIPIIFCLFLYITPLPTSHSRPTLPPPLSHIHLPTRSSYPPASASSWKQPAVLTAHATPLNNSHISLTLFSTGVDTQSFSRVFTPLACLLNHTTAFPLASIYPSISTCHVPQTALRPGTHLTILLRNDWGLREALAGPQQLHGELFELQDGDVTPLREHRTDELILHGKRLTSQLRREGGPGMAYIRSDVLWEQRLLDTVEADAPRYELCVMTAMKQYPFLLPSWLEYYRRVGVDQVFVYDNDAPEDLERMLTKWKGFAQVVYWPWPRSQMQSNNHFLFASKTRCRFVAFFDADEFVMVGGPPGKLATAGGNDNAGGQDSAIGKSEGVKLRDLPLLKRYVLFHESQGYKQISFRFLVMVNSGYVHRPKGNLPELYVHRAKVQAMSSGKVVIDTERNWMHHKIHMVKGSGNKMYWNTSLELSPRSVEHSAMLVHYTHRSWEDFVAKNKVGGASVMTAGRPPKVLDVEKPDPAYMGEASIKFEGFRDRWRELMKIKDTGRVMLTWKTEDSARCRASYCPKCRISMSLGQSTCTAVSVVTRR